MSDALKRCFGYNSKSALVLKIEVRFSLQLHTEVLNDTSLQEVNMSDNVHP
jgi:hypothetical protein